MRAVQSRTPSSTGLPVPWRMPVRATNRRRSRRQSDRCGEAIGCPLQPHTPREDYVLGSPRAAGLSAQSYGQIFDQVPRLFGTTSQKLAPSASAVGRRSRRRRVHLTTRLILRRPIRLILCRPVRREPYRYFIAAEGRYVCKAAVGRRRPPWAYAALGRHRPP